MARPSQGTLVDGVVPGGAGRGDRCLRYRLVSVPCRAQRHGIDPGIPGQYRRSNVFIGEDVEAELPEALAKVAADMVSRSRTPSGR